MHKKILPVILLPLLFAGCATTFTNLTPQQQTRTTNDLYTVEVALSSRQQTMRWQTIRPQIVVGNDTYPMKLTPLMTNRWEGVLPVAPGTKEVTYRYRFNYEVNAFGPPRAETAMSPPYTLRIVE